jgi:hypothetical protein
MGRFLLVVACLGVAMALGFAILDTIFPRP